MTLILMIPVLRRSVYLLYLRILLFHLYLLMTMLHHLLLMIVLPPTIHNAFFIHLIKFFWHHSVGLGIVWDLLSWHGTCPGLCCWCYNFLWCHRGRCFTVWTCSIISIHQVFDTSDFNVCNIIHASHMEPLSLFESKTLPWNPSNQEKNLFLFWFSIKSRFVVMDVFSPCCSSPSWS